MGILAVAEGLKLRRMETPNPELWIAVLIDSFFRKQWSREPTAPVNPEAPRASTVASKKHYRTHLDQ
jgi:hypothetical protein